MGSKNEGLAARLAWGIAAGAAATTALNAVTYADMLLRGRPASEVPAKAAGILADKLEIAPLRSTDESPAADARRQGMGALLGYATGIGVGVAYALVRGGSGRAPRLGAGLALGLAAMAAGDAPIALTGASDPREWSATDWLSDLVPHLAYGFVVTAVFEGRRDG